MPRRRIILRRGKEEILSSARNQLASLDKNPPANKQDLRDTIAQFVRLGRDVKELARFHITEMLPFNSAAERILGYLRMFVGQKVEGEELEVVSGISEYARRVREWRVEFGMRITHSGSKYVLEQLEPDESKAELWRTLNTIRRKPIAALDKMAELFKALPVGTIVTTAQLRYVTDNKDMRRRRELRDLRGMRIMTRYTGMPQLKSGEYVLIDADPMEPHDRNIDKDAVIAVLKRDGNRCQKCGWHPKDRVPGDPRQYIELHHINWHAEGGSNAPENLATLCNFHHKAVHTLRLNPEDFKRWLSEPAA